MPALKKYFLWMILLLSMANNLCAQASFSLMVSDKNIGKSDILQVVYTITNAEETHHFSPPFFNDWNIVTGPDYSREDRIVNNHHERKLSYTYNIIPKKAGELEVPATTVIADGKKLFCKAVKINVSNKDNIVTVAPSQPPVGLPSLLDGFKKDPVKQSGTPEATIQDNIFIKLTTSKTHCFVGEPVLVTYQLFSALRSQSKVSKQPAFNGCSVVEMTTDTPPETQEINGRQFRVFLIRKVQLIPLQAGRLVLDTAIVESEVSLVSPDNPYQVQTYTSTTKSPLQTIEVKSLPVANKPDSFSGAVGKFSITAKVDSLHIPAGENNNLRITIEGEGNMENISAPVVHWPQGTEYFEGTDSQYIDKMSFPEKGTVLWDIPFVVTRPGLVHLPEISFAYFDPAKGTYHTVKTKTIAVTAGAALSKTDRYKQVVHENVTNKKYLWIIFGIALTVIIIWMVSFRKKRSIPEKNTANKQTADNALPKTNISTITSEKTVNKADVLAELKLLENILDPQEFFGRMKAILTTVLQEKLQTDATSETVLLAILEERLQDVSLVDMVKNIYNVINRCLYSPVADDNLKESVYMQLMAVAEKLGFKT